MKSTIELQFHLNYAFPITFTQDVFHPENPVLADILRQAGRANRIMVVVDSNLAAANPYLIKQVEAYAHRHTPLMQVVAPPFIMTGGEACKNSLEEVEKIHALIYTYHLCRHSFVMAIGGGAVLDAAGFATATAHRGIRLLRLPTTTLAQNDAGVGVKNSVNRFGKKNFIGTFAPPFAVINDQNFLQTLQERDLRAGMAEAVKVALIKDRAFFEYLYAEKDALRRFDAAAMSHMIRRCAELHTRHIQTNGDPFEQGTSRPLDFGHWAAHKIEDLAHDDVRHGEAVAVGVALDCLYSHYYGLISELELYRILTLIRAIGFELFHPALLKMDIVSSLDDFREHMGGELTIPLINGIGSLVEVHEIQTPLVARGIEFLSTRSGRKGVAHDRQSQSHECPAGVGLVLP